MESLPDYYAYNEKFFRRYAPVYDIVAAPFRSLRREVVALSNIRPGQAVLDVACGTGEQTLAFAQAGCSIVGVDLSEDMLARARAKVPKGVHIQFVRRDASSLPYDTASFDATTVSFGLHDMPPGVAHGVLTEMRRVTKPHGRIMVVDYAAPRRLIGKLGHTLIALFESKWYRSFMRKGLHRLLREAGIRVEASHPRFGGAIEVAACFGENGHEARAG